MKLEPKTLLKINFTASLILALYLSIKGSINKGWFSCLGIMRVRSCSWFGWLLQIIILIAVFVLIFTGIWHGVKYLIKSVEKEEVKEKVEEVKKEIEEEKPTEEPKKKEVIKI